jgi:hypothetical protein
MQTVIERIPEHLRPRNEGTDQLFKDSWLEKFTRTHISVPVTMHLLITIGVSYFALQQHNFLTFILLFGAGWLTWTFSEYWVHRYVYHVHTDKKWLLKIQHLGHGIHHQYPKDPTRLAMPPLPAIILLSGFFGIFLADYATLRLSIFPRIPVRIHLIHLVALCTTSLQVTEVWSLEKTMEIPYDASLQVSGKQSVWCVD